MKSKKIINFDHDDVDMVCKEHQKKHPENCDNCLLKRDGDCKAYLFIDRDTLNSIIKEIFGNEEYIQK